MQTPEEVAREVRRLTWDVLGNDGLVEEDGPALAALIRARDAEVRAEAVTAENARLRQHRRAALLEAMTLIGYAALAADATTGRYEGLCEAREIVRSLLDPPTEGEAP